MGFTCYGYGPVSTNAAVTSPVAARGLRLIAAVVVALLWECAT
jgi:hypothetical protein